MTTKKSNDATTADILSESYLDGEIQSSLDFDNLDDVVYNSSSSFDISEIADLPVLVDEARNVLFFHGVNLVNNQNHRRFAFSHALGDMLFTGPDEMGRLHEPEHHVHLVPSALLHLLLRGGQPVGNLQSLAISYVRHYVKSF